jgi:hypothetical protein
VRSGAEVGTGEYQVVYRSVQECRAIADDAGLHVVTLEAVGVKWPKLINNFVLLERATSHP